MSEAAERQPNHRLASTALKRIPMAAIVFFLSFIVMSPALAVVGVKGSLVLLVALIFLLANGRLLGHPLHITVYVLGYLYVLAAGGLSIYWGSLVPLYFAILYVSVLIVVANTKDKEIELVVHYATRTFAVMIVLAWAGLLYFFLGGQAVASIANPNGTDNFLYLTTLTNVVRDNYIRPSGIYDEPGAFAFFISALCTLREILRKNKNVTALLLVGGLVTLSIAHVIYMAFHFGSYVVSAKKKKSFAVLVVALLALSTAFIVPQVRTIVQEVIVERAVEYRSGGLTNPREVAMLNVYNKISAESLLVGFGRGCAARSLEECATEIGHFGENVLTPIVYGGITLAWPYYLIVVALIVYGSLAPKNLFLVGFALLLFQRPYVLEFPYSATIFLIVLALLYRNMRGRWPLETKSSMEPRSA